MFILSTFPSLLKKIFSFFLLDLYFFSIYVILKGTKMSMMCKTCIVTEFFPLLRALLHDANIINNHSSKIVTNAKNVNLFPKKNNPFKGEFQT